MHVIEFNTNDFIEDITKSVPIFTIEGNEYKWAHKSFQEYFSACYIMNDSLDKDNLLNMIAFSKNNRSYFNIMDFCYDLDLDIFRKIVLYKLSKDYIALSNQLNCNIGDTLLTNLLTNDVAWISIKKFQINKDSSFEDEAREHVFKIMEKAKAKCGYSLKYRLQNEEIYILFCGFENKYLTIINLLDLKRSELIRGKRDVGMDIKSKDESIVKKYLNKEINVLDFIENNKILKELEEHICPYCVMDNKDLNGDVCKNIISDIESQSADLDNYEGYEF